MNWYKKAQSDTIYEDETGYIKGYQLPYPEGYWLITWFVINPEYRGKGLAKELAKHIPQKAILLSKPQKQMGSNILNNENLLKFYKSLGFRERDKNLLQRD